MRFAVVALSLMGTVSCRRKPAPVQETATPAVTPPNAIPDATEVLKTFFAAAQAKDCPKLAKVLLVRRNVKPPEQYCADVIEDFEHHDTKLLSFDPGWVDGREPNVVVFKTQVYFPKKTLEKDHHEWMMRVEFKDGAWKVRF